MDSLLQLSTIACEAERLNERSISSDSTCSNESTLTFSIPQINNKEISSSRCQPPTGINKKPCDQIQENDRKAIKDKLRTALVKKAPAYDDLLDLCVALSEEHIYEEAPSKLDYYKSGISCVKKIFEKSAELHAAPEPVLKVAPSVEESGPRVVKRAKTLH